ncbi:Clavaminate synthase-like protein [Fistulina hepatica ATCC 64428]|uniref:Clavaminate synthase-like protein n=1 Tax=Fistulina hepatica ATCC 64428 TaxID=1128425 RepID=A0A0D7ADM2_9AGAR|nr:Clavaminate synthase-like protein [Fistulina hepatica ATCC 64428]
MSANFSSVPILNYELAQDPGRRQEFIEQLRHALINVGFLYLSNPPVDQELLDTLVDKYIPQLFALPDDKKLAIRMSNSPHFLGYSKLGAEFTKGAVDYREQFDFATPHISRWKPGDPDYYNLWGPSQWPDEKLVPGFRAIMEKYMLQVQELSYVFAELASEALGLPPGKAGLARFCDTPDLMQHRSKIVKYPPVSSDAQVDQGVGPHYDAGFLTFLLQASDHPGLQVQNLSGEWIDTPPIPKTFVVNIGKALEFVTRGLARATSHRVLSPRGSTPRYSVPFFQNIGLHIRLADSVLDFPEDILRLRNARGSVSATDSVNFTEFDREPSGQVNLIGRVKSHPDVGQIHYPELFKQIFPHGLPATANAY